MKNRYHTLQWTWGIIMNIIGFVVYEFCVKVLKYDHYDYHGAKCAIVPNNNGFGLSLGMYIIRTQNAEAVMFHEFGHSIQNIFFGPLFPFLVAIPSAIRFWYRRSQTAQGIKLETGYYDIWFERQATNLGEIALNHFDI